MGLSLSTPRAAWVSPAAAKAPRAAVMSAEATPRPRHSASVAERHDPSVAAPGHLVVGFVPAADTDGDRLLVAIDGDEREVGPRAEAVDLSCHVVADTGVEPQWSANVALRTTSNSPSRSSGQLIGSTRRRPRRRGGSVGQWTPQLLEPAHRLEPEPQEQPLVGVALLVGLDADALGQVAVAGSQQLRLRAPSPTASAPVRSLPRWAGATVPGMKQRSWTTSDGMCTV